MAGRAGVKLPLEDFDTISRKTPRLADLRPAGRFLMDDFYFAGGLPAPEVFPLAEIEAMAHEVFAGLPAHFRALCEGLIIHVEDFPTDEVLDQMEAASEFDLLGLFQKMIAAPKPVQLDFRDAFTLAREFHGRNCSNVSDQVAQSKIAVLGK